MKLLTTLIASAVLIAAGLTSPARAAAPKTKPKSSSTVTQAKGYKAKVKSTTPSRVRCMYSRHPKDAKRKIKYILVSGPKHGKVTMPAAHKKYYWKSSGTATYTSNPGYVGQDSFKWKLNDGHGESEAATCTIDVLAAVPVPQMRETSLVAAGKSVEIPVAYTGGGGYSHAIKHTKPANGSVSMKGTTFVYTPKAGFAGTDSFSWHMAYGKTKAAATKPTETLTCWIVVKKPGMTDWPQWRADAWRSAFTTMQLPSKLHLQWRRDIPATKSPFAARRGRVPVYADIDYCRPVQLGKMLFVPVTASDRLSAYDTETGKLRWSFYASGVVRRPPAALKLPGGKNAVIFGSDDGHVYCLNAADGKLRWKFRGAPNSRTAMGFRRLSSAWPIWASPVIAKGKVYFAAGYIPSFGIYAYCLDAATGRPEWVNDGRITDMWNTSTFGPLAISYDGSEVYGSVEGASRPWAVDSSTGKFLGHLGIGFEFSGSGKQKRKETMRKGGFGWYVDGRPTYHNIPEPMTITTGTREFTRESVAKLGVTGTIASLLAGDGKLFVTTAEGGIYCFGSKPGKATVYPYKTAPLPNASSSSTAAAKTMLSREDLKQGLALVLGVKDGRLVEELARQSSLMVVAVDPDGKKLQALRARADAAGLSGARISTLEGNPLDFAFAPYQAALITSEDPKLASMVKSPAQVEKLYTWTRPFGGEVWLPTSGGQHGTLAGFHAKSKKVPLSEVKRAGNYTRMVRKGLPDEALRIKPPFGLVAFGSERIIPPYLSLTTKWRGRDVYSWLALTSKMPGRVPAPSTHNKLKGFPTPATLTTSNSVFSRMLNPLSGTVEQFPGLPSSGCDRSCSAMWSRDGDFGLTHGKISSFFDASSHYWGRLFFPEAGGCPGRMVVWNGVLVNSSTPVPGSTCGCSAAMQFTTFAIAPMEYEETWVNYQRVRTGNPVEDMPIRQVGVNFGAPGDRLSAEEGLLWTHHPYSGRYGRCSYNFASMPEALPLVPVTYSGPVKSVYHHSAGMDRSAKRYRGWVSASQVKGMTAISVPLAQPAVATRTAAAPKVDGNLEDSCWKDARKLVFAVNRTVTDRDLKTGLPKPDEHCYVMLRYDDQNLYIAGGVNAEYGPPTSYRADTRRSITVKLNSRERIAPDVVVTGTSTHYRGKITAKQESTGLARTAWKFAGRSTKQAPYAAELALPWKALEAAGLWKDQLIVNVTISGGSIVGNYFLKQYVPLYLGKPRGPATRGRSYTVRLYFAEMEGAKPGARVFDVGLQGKTVLQKLDVVKEAGGARRELMKEFKNIAISEALKISFKASAGEAMLSGVEIVGAYDAKKPAPNAPPTAAIQAGTLSGPAPLVVTLDARKSGDPDGQIVKCAWDTGDGRLASGSQLKHVYAEPGEYQVRLRVRDNRGAIASKSVTVKVTAGRPAAFVCRISAQGGDFATLSAWESAMRSDMTKAAMLFKVSARGSYARSDNGKKVTFSGGGTGTLRHISGTGLAYVTDCKGSIKPGAAKCASGHSFTTSDSGNPVCALVAELHGNLPGGAKAGSGWKTDALHCPVIRAAKGSTGLKIQGDLDLGAVSHLRLTGIVVDSTKQLVLGAHTSAINIKAGTVKVQQGASVAGCTATSLSAAKAANTPVSTYTLNVKRLWKMKKYRKSVNSHISFYKCAAQSFDSGNQAGVEFVKCTVAPGGKGYIDNRYSEPPIVVK
jgi:outer membrane protein assembly factor BamB/PKD repeat protein